MWGWGWGMGHAGYGLPYWWLGVGFRIIVLAAVVTGIVYLVRYLARQGRLGHHEESPLEILQKRYARGEITREQYEEMKRDLG